MGRHKQSADFLFTNKKADLGGLGGATEMGQAYEVLQFTYIHPKM